MPKPYIPTQRGTTSDVFRIGDIDIDASAASTPWTFALPSTAGTSGYVLRTDGSGNLSWVANGSGTPAGSNTQIQYNNSGSFGASSDFTYNNTTKVLTLGNFLIDAGAPSTTPVLITGNSGTTTATGFVIEAGADTTSGLDGGSVLINPGTTIAGGVVLYAAGASGGGNTAGTILIETGTASGGASKNLGIQFVTAGNSRLRINHDGNWTVGGSSGTAGQVLTSNGGSSSPSWQAPAGASPLTTKGDLYTFTTVNARLPVGTNGQVLSANSAQSTGLEWVAPSGSVYYKDAVRGATTANITLSGNVVLDGITTAPGDRILVKNQTTASQNGIYVAAAGAWSRATDFDTSGTEVSNGCIIPVAFGTANGGSTWQLVQNGGTIGSSFRFAPLNGIAASGQGSWTTPISTGTNSIAIGSASSATNTNGISIGTSTVNPGNSIVIGPGSQSNSTSASYGNIVIGRSCVGNFNVTEAILIGFSAGNTTNGNYGIGIGSNVNAGSDRAIAIGEAATVASSGGWTTRGMAIGAEATAATNASFVSTGPISIGYGATTASVAETTIGAIALGRLAQSQYAGAAIGTNAKTDFAGHSVITFGAFATRGDMATGFVNAWMTTTDAIPTELKTLTPGSSAATTPTGIIRLTNDSSYIFDCDIVARNTATDAESAMYNLKFGIRRGTNAASTTLVGTPVVTVIGEDTGTTTWDVGVTADTTNGRPNISVTGEAAKTIRWVANIRMTKVSG